MNFWHSRSSQVDHHKWADLPEPSLLAYTKFKNVNDDLDLNEDLMHSRICKYGCLIKATECMQ